MAFQNFDDDFNKTIYDLRQVYSLELLKPTLIQIDSARKLSNFPLLFKLLSRDFLADLNQKLKIKEREAVRDEIKKAREIIKKYPQEYLWEANFYFKKKSKTGEIEVSFI